MRIFLAGAFNHRDEIKVVRAALEDQGHTVTSSWLDEPPLPDVGTDWFRRATAITDLYDLEHSDAMALFTFWPSLSGGWHTELGVALNRGIPVYRVGPEASFYSQLAAESYDTIDEFVAALADRTPIHTEQVSAMGGLGGWGAFNQSLFDEFFGVGAAEAKEGE